MECYVATVAALIINTMGASFENLATARYKYVFFTVIKFIFMDGQLC